MIVTKPSTNVFWIPANSTSRLTQGWTEIARNLKIPGHEDALVNVFQIVQDYLSRKHQTEWLIVLDNADDESIVFGAGAPFSDSTQSKNLLAFLPSSDLGRIIVTTRDRRVGEKLIGRESLINVQTLDDRDALTLLHANTSDVIQDHGQALDLIKEIGHLPLAITQAAAFITQNQISLEEYLLSLRAGESEIRELLDQQHYDIRRDHESQASILRTWRLSFHLIEKQNPGAVDLVSLIAILDYHRIPRFLLEDGQSRVGLNLALGILQAFFLLVADEQGQAFSMHPLVARATQAWLESDPQKSSRVRATAIKVLAKKFPNDTLDRFEECEMLLPHFQAVLRYEYESKDTELSLATLLERGASYYGERGRYKDQIEMLTRAKQIKETILGQEHPEVLDYVRQIGDAEEGQGRYKVAEDLHRQVYQSRSRTLGEKHLSTLQSLGAVGGTLWLQGRYGAARDIYETAWTSLKDAVGPLESETLSCLQNLAVTYEELGDLPKAEQMIREVLAREIEVKGESNPTVAAVVGDLASCLQRQGKNEQSTQLRFEALEMMKKALGYRHPLSVTSLGYYAGALWYEGKYVEGEARQREALALRSELLPPDHPDTLQNMDDLSYALLALHKYEEAETLTRQVIAKRTQIMGIEHPKTLESMTILASLLHHQGNDLASEQIQLSLLATRLRTLGSQHLSTLHNMDEVAGSLWAQEKFPAALEMQQRVLAERRIAQGSSHPQTLESMDHVIGSSWGQNKLPEATILLREALKLREQRYGEEDPETLIRMTRLAYLIRIQGNKDEAIELYERALSLYQKTLGLEDPTTKECSQSLVDTLAEKTSMAAIESPET